MAKYTEQEVRDAAEGLLAALDAAGVLPKTSDACVYACVKRVSRSGMSRCIDFWVIIQKGSSVPYLQRIAQHVSVLNGTKRDDAGVCVNGCGMDMGWHVLNAAVACAFRVLGREYDGKRDQIQPVYI